MAAQVVYGVVEFQRVDGKPKLTVQLSPKVKLNANKFDVNNELYVHVHSRTKSISMTWQEYEDLCAAHVNVSQQLHLLEQNTQQQQPPTQLMVQAPPQMVGQQAPPQMVGQQAPSQIPTQQAPSQGLAAQRALSQGLVAQQAPSQGLAAQTARHGQIQVAVPTVWDDFL